ncbi:DUF6285 domain-containing protein [Cupriavidus metallidurans]|uniref:DUF6285 domain-containing protein n=1 Tax=Cupriavidus metallidurans (strain ATCC 43123 / DSM 2839 / NBRC 102507 / CH34) TaxID=266264 RepID=Q1LBU1_CUPMC|nr:DUF6285 domain-containing protein [Cupriavidus metallidurans]ABF12385.1 conserved hypothetical protein [Cupriavidus metallidurans CH34]QGS32385.1 hypothetical protein FOB83_26485 [Cupriavidus metallidurans]
MSTFVPDANRLLQAAAEYLERELLPTLTGYHGFQTRVCINVLKIVARELEMRPEAQARERRRLEDILGKQGDVGALNRELATRLGAGDLPLDHVGVVEHLISTLQDALSINSPRWAKQVSD